jgi:nucleoside-diphosphate-sugar epimerase
MNQISLLITGATGYIGNTLTKYLLKRNFVVHMLIRKASDLLDLADNSNTIIHIYNGEFTSVKEIFNKHKINVVIHLATLLTKSDEIQDIELLQEVSVRLTNQIFAAIRNIKDFKGVLNIGSILQITDKYNSYYSLYKGIQEEIAKYNSYKYNIKVLSLLVNSTYSYGDWNHSSLINQIKQSVIYKKPLHINNPSFEMELLFIDDLCQAILKSIDLLFVSKNRFMRYRTFVLEKIRISELIRIIELITKSTANITIQENQSKIVNLHLNEDVEFLPGWSPLTDLSTGLTRFFEEKE